MKKVLLSTLAATLLSTSAFASDFTHSTLFGFGKQKIDSDISGMAFDFNYNTYANKDAKEGLVKHFVLKGTGEQDIKVDSFGSMDYIGGRVEFMLGYGIYLNDFVNLPFESSINPLAGANITFANFSYNINNIYGVSTKLNSDTYSTWTLKAGANWHNVINDTFVINADMYFGKYVGGDKEITDFKSSEFNTSIFAGVRFSSFIIGATIGYEDSAIAKGTNYYISFGKYY